MSALVVGAGTIVYGSVPHTFNAGDTLQAADLNSNFAALEQRIATLEAAKSTVKVILDNSGGPLPAGTGKTATFTSAGGAVTLLVSGTAWANGLGAVLDVTVTLDGQAVGDLKAVTNETNSHKAFPTKAFYVATLVAGTHTLGMTASSTTTTDAGDYFNATVIELAH